MKMNIRFSYLIFTIMLSVFLFPGFTIAAQDINGKEVIVQMWENRNDGKDSTEETGNNNRREDQTDETDQKITGPESRSDEPPSYDREEGEYPVYH